MYDKRFRIEEMIKNVVEEEFKYTIKKNQMYRDGKDINDFFFENKEI